MLQISFIIPLYNQVALIKKCLMSILSSSINEDSMEILVWNDGSTDGCEKVVEELAVQHQCIRLVNSTNHGVSYARNQALQEAKGEYVWFVDSDDMVKSENVRSILNVIMEEMPDTVLFNWESILNNGTTHKGIHPIIKKELSTGREQYLRRPLNMAPWCFIYKRFFLLENSLVFPNDFRTCEDIQFNQKVLFFSKRMLTIPIIGYQYREMSTSATNGNELRVAKDQIRRLKYEIDFYYYDTPFLFEIVYRNLREINVWLAKCEPDKEMFITIKKVLRDYHIPFSFSHKYIFVTLMGIMPTFVYNLQKLAHYIKQFFFISFQ